LKWLAILQLRVPIEVAGGTPRCFSSPWRFLSTFASSTFPIYDWSIHDAISELQLVVFCVGKYSRLFTFIHASYMKFESEML